MQHPRRCAHSYKHQWSIGVFQLPSCGVTADIFKMNSSFVLFLMVAFVVPHARPDNIFAKGGTCMYKISTSYQKCMDRQNARLVRDKESLEPIHTRDALIDSVNKISCCAYWEFLSCVEDLADRFCSSERRDMIAYTRQLGSAVPVQDCQEKYPRHSSQCNGTSSLFLSSGLILLLVLLVPLLQ